jgi:hypothetical protein
MFATELVELERELWASEHAARAEWQATRAERDADQLEAMRRWADGDAQAWIVEGEEN